MTRAAPNGAGDAFVCLFVCLLGRESQTIKATNRFRFKSNDRELLLNDLERKENKTKIQ